MSRILKDKDYKVTNPYGDGHVGIDVISANGGKTEVIAHTSGVVHALVDNKVNEKGATGLASYGNYVQIKHDGGYYTLYAHMQKGLKVKKGERVEKGQVLGVMGNTGNSYGEHLHFEVRNPQNYVINPTEYLEKDLPNEIKEEKITLYYRVHLLKENKWLDWVKESDSPIPKYDEYAGLYGKEIDGLQIKIVNEK